MKLILFLILLLVLACGASSASAESLPDKLPGEYAKPVGGTVLRIEYPSKDYFGDGAEVTKPALVYLPAGYSEDQRYDLLVLCHGVGGTEEEWGFLSPDAYRSGKNLVDNLIAGGEIRPLIIVMPNGRSCADYGNTNMSNMYPFYSFGQELRNDLLPWMDAHYATYGAGLEDLSASRDHRFMAGLSMGGMQTINIGMCECLDLFSAFGAFSAAPTSYPAAKIAGLIEQFDNCPIRLFYSVCGLQDALAYSAASQAAKALPEKTDRLTEENWIWQECAGSHEFPIWNLGLFNFLRLLNR